MNKYDVIIIGAGAAGLMCAIEAGKRGRKTWLIDHAEKTAEKIRISGGGRCNFTNLHTTPENYISENPHFCKSALAGFTPADFIALLDKHGLTYHEKTLGQLFCDQKSSAVIDMLLSEIKAANVRLDMGTNVQSVHKNKNTFHLETNKGPATCGSLVIASGGLSIPKIGASPFGYEIARQFGLKIIDPAPALVPLTFSGALLEHCKALSGLSVDAIVNCGKTAFREGLLFTHRGLSGPSILQISSYWREGQNITINLAPNTDAYTALKDAKTQRPKQNTERILSGLLPERLAKAVCEELGLQGRIADLKDSDLKRLAARINEWHIKPQGSEGYRTAEVTRGGVDTECLSSKTMECRTVPGLFFIGEVIDVTGWLGGYNFQWAWASGYAAGQAA